MKLRSLLAAGLAVCALAFSSCSSTGEITFSGEWGSEEIDRNAKNWFLGRSVAVQDLNSRQRNDRMELAFDFVNRTGEDIHIQWSIDWFDADGFVVESFPTWKPLYLPPRAEVPVSTTATSPAALKWRIHVREVTPLR